MVARVTSELFVAALARNVRAAGGFAYIARRGNEQAGAIHVAVYGRDHGGYALYQPAPQSLTEDADRSDRSFGSPNAIADEAELAAFRDSEARFDSDFWLVEIENLNVPVETLITVVTD